MTESHLITGLLQTRAEMAGQIEHLELTLSGLREGLGHVDATLRIVGYDGPGISVGAKRSGTAGLFHRNELNRYVLSFYRLNPDGFTARNLAETIRAERGWDMTQGPL